MIKFVSFITVMLLCCLLIFCDINKEPLNSDEPTGAATKYFEFTDYGCQGNELNLDKATFSKTFLQKYFFNKDTLTLRIHYSANCCPAFVDSVSVTQNLVEIALADTLNGCRCVCDFDNDFSFLYYDEGELRIIFKWWDMPKNQFITEMDTTIFLTR